MLIPTPLKPGDRVAIISPASIVKPEYIDGAARLLAAEGFEPVIMPHAKGPAHGSYAASDADRLADITVAYSDPSIRAILCSRGGYGCNHLLADLDPALIAADPKWLIGFSDVSALHALSQYAGVVSLHAPMAKHLTELGPDHYCTQALLRILRQGLPVEYLIPSHPLNRPGEATGRLVGGNLAVINGLAATPLDPLSPDPPSSPTSSSPISNPLDLGSCVPPVSGGSENCARRFSAGNPPRIILFIEDIAEQIYAVERMLIRLRLAGQLDSLAGLIVGQFTEYRPDRNHPDMYSMISNLLSHPKESSRRRLGKPCQAAGRLEKSAASGTPFPVCFNFPAGHTDNNLPLPLGATAHLSVTPQETTLTLL